MKQAQLFHIQREGSVAGPYDLVQMAGMLRRKIITGETPTRLQGEEAWKPFSWQPQFFVAREMPSGATSDRTLELDEEAASRAAGPIPLPSLETVIRFAAFVVFLALLAGVSFLLSWLDPELGYGLLVIGGGLVVVAQAFIMVRILDEDSWTLAKIWFIPGYDGYYLVSNIWVYWRSFALKYIGLAVCLGAALGLGFHR